MAFKMPEGYRPQDETLEIGSTIITDRARSALDKTFNSDHVAGSRAGVTLNESIVIQGSTAGLTPVEARTMLLDYDSEDGRFIQAIPAPVGGITFI